jgi:hypothetical protein
MRLSVAFALSMSFSMTASAACAAPEFRRSDVLGLYRRANAG